MKGVGNDTVINVLGRIAPVVVMLPITPMYLRVIGTSRYGVLMVFWTFVGYFGALDLGLGRAVTNRVAQLSHNNTAKGKLFWTAVIVALLFGCMVSTMILLTSSFIVSSLFQVPPLETNQIHHALWLIATTYPLVVAGSVFAGTLRGERRFLKLNIINGINAILSQIAPLAVAIGINKSFFLIIASASIMQSLSILWMLYECLCIPEYRQSPGISISEISQLVKYGRWVSLSSMIGPLLVGLDRIVINMKMGVAAVPYYVIPANLSAQLLVIPGGLASSLFPLLSSQHVDDSALARESLHALAVVLVPIAILTTIAIKPFLSMWISQNFANIGTPIALILTGGAVVNGLAHVPNTLLTAKGRPDIVAKFHALQVIPFILILWVNVHFWGLEGAAWAWVIRVTGDALLLLFATRKTPWGLSRIAFGIFLFIIVLGVNLKFAWRGAILPSLGLFFVSIGWANRSAPHSLRKWLRGFVVNDITINS